MHFYKENEKHFNISFKFNTKNHQKFNDHITLNIKLINYCEQMKMNTSTCFIQFSWIKSPIIIFLERLFC